VKQKVEKSGRKMEHIVSFILGIILGYAYFLYNFLCDRVEMLIFHSIIHIRNKKFLLMNHIVTGYYEVTATSDEVEGKILYTTSLFKNGRTLVTGLPYNAQCLSLSSITIKLKKATNVDINSFSLANSKCIEKTFIGDEVIHLDKIFEENKGAEKKLLEAYD
jgi:hypothetical protein